MKVLNLMELHVKIEIILMKSLLKLANKLLTNADDALHISTYQASLSVSAILTMLCMSASPILTNADDALHVSTYQASLSASGILTMLCMSASSILTMLCMSASSIQKGALT